MLPIPNFSPMLAAPMREEKDETLDKLSYPLIASPKIDGIRALCNPTPFTRALKQFPNKHVASMLSQKEFAFLDGELLVGNGDNFQAVTSAIMSQKGEPEFTFHVFDWFGDPTLPYTARLISYKRIVRQLQDRFPFLRAVYTEIVNDEDELKAFTAKCLADGYEGAMVRRPTSPYKFGRATFKEGYLTKVKPFEDDEAEIVGFEEQMENRNEKTVNELGKSKRSSHQANKVPKGTLGALIVKHKTFGEFNIGTGFDDAFRKMVWSNRSAYLGQLVKFRYQLAGMKDKPRIPSFKGLRHPFDL